MKNEPLDSEPGDSEPNAAENSAQEASGEHGVGEVSDGPTAREAYNIVSDTFTGANIRVKDNVYQAIAIAVGLLLGIGIGALVMTQDRILGAVAGGFIGLLVGLFGSGIFLMIFRAVSHLRGKHD